MTSGEKSPFMAHRDAIAAWKPQSEIWPLVYGNQLGALCVAGSSFTILMRTRQFLNLFTQQQLLETILPVVGLPTVGFLIASELFIERKLAQHFSMGEGYKPICTTCIELRGSVIQVQTYTLCGRVYCMVTNGFTCFTGHFWRYTAIFAFDGRLWRLIDYLQDLSHS